MCGIAGFIDFNKRSEASILKGMTDILEHRGPDGEGQHFLSLPEYQLGLGHRRLAIIDLSDAGKQPMQFKQFTLTFNGEIYNYKEIKTELEALQHNFIGGSDSEVILHAYDQWGESCLSKFIGMFAIVIHDMDKNELFCARDRAGVKPLFYYQKDGLFMFSSELKSFHKHPSFQKEIDPDAVAAFMQYGNVPTPHCIFKYTQKVKPGHWLKLSMLSKSVEEKQYWNVYDAYNQPKLDISYDEAKSSTSKILKSAFEYRMVSDVPVGIFLSGGYDSVCVAAMLQENRSKKLKTFTIGVPDIGLNEAPYARDIAKHIGTDHTEIICTENEAIDLIKDLPFFYDEPYADSSAIPTTLVSKIARKDVTVCLSADAGDEIFAGYNRYDYLLRYRSKMNKIPAFLRFGMVGLMNATPSNRIPILKNKYNFHNRYEKLKGILKDPSDEKIMLSLSQQFTDKQMKSIMSNEVHSLSTSYDSNELQQEFYSPLAYMMGVDYQTYLLDDILQKVDRATMTASLEGREPFLDHRIIEYAAQLPDDYKYKDGVKKRILKDIVHEYVPQHLLDRPKMGFAIPIANWLLNELKPLVDEFCSEKELMEHNLFNIEEINKLIFDFYKGKKEFDMKIWYLLMFQMWYSKWMK